MEFRKFQHSWSLRVGKLRISCWRRWRQAGFSWENRWRQDRYIHFGWGRRMVHSRFAMMFSVGWR